MNDAVKAIEVISESLNPPQKEAVHTLEGPLLILAGAGSGKTRVLTHRIANLVAQGLAAPDQFLAVTFTNKAAREMEHRISGILRKIGVDHHERMWISTFHSICARLLREHIHLLDYQSFFGIYDQSDQLSMIKKILVSLNLDEKAHPPKTFASRINHAKNEALTPEEIHKKPHLMDDISLSVYEKYETEMKRANALDFADLLLKAYQLFRDYPAVLEAYEQKFRYLLVDEYQDTNHIQYLLVKLLAARHRNLCVVGDEDQSIYSWRGADISNILNFEKDFPDCKVIKLEQNYRSTKTIVNAATAVIRNNTQRKDKTLFTEGEPGEPIIVREEATEYDEARFVVRDIQTQMNDSDLSFSDVAVFYRTNAQSRVLEEQLRTHNIPYRIVGGIKFYERMEIKDILAYMKLVLNPGDDIALKRIINVPARGIGKTTTDRIEQLSAEMGMSMVQGAAHAVDHREFHAGATRKVREFLHLLQELRGKATALSLSEFYHAILDATGYVQRLKNEDTPEADSRVENLEEFDNAISRFNEERGEEATLQSFLEEMSLVQDTDTMDDAEQSVTLMTLHISKGLEYPHVYIVGLEENLFPSGRAVGSGNLDDIEEERRLAYVGMTRARLRLTLTCARTRKVWGSDQINPQSRFLKEIPPEMVNFQSTSPRPRFMQNAVGRVPRGDPMDAGRRQPGAGDGFADDVYGNGSKTHPLMNDGVPDYENFADFDFDSQRAQSEYQKGMRVRHPTYGVGSISATEGQGENLKVSVMFPDKTIKKFVAKYARLEKV